MWKCIDCLPARLRIDRSKQPLCLVAWREEETGERGKNERKKKKKNPERGRGFTGDSVSASPSLSSLSPESFLFSWAVLLAHFFQFFSYLTSCVKNKVLKIGWGWTVKKKPHTNQKKQTAKFLRNSFHSLWIISRTHTLSRPVSISLSRPQHCLENEALL